MDNIEYKIEGDALLLEEPKFLMENEISREFLGASIKVHKELGPGLLESAYEFCLFHELKKRGLEVEKQVLLPIHFDGKNLDAGYRIDLLVNKKVIVEIKSVSELNDIHLAQILTYL